MNARQVMRDKDTGQEETPYSTERSKIWGERRDGAQRRCRRGGRERGEEKQKGKGGGGRSKTEETQEGAKGGGGEGKIK